MKHEKYPEDLTGIRFGRTEALWLGRDDVGKLWWWCKCECGNEFSAKRMSLVCGGSRCCDECQEIKDEKERVIREAKREERKSRNFHARKKQLGSGERGKHIVDGKLTLTAVSFHSARSRCNNPKVTGYQNWGGRGIEFRFKTIDELIEAIGERPSKEYSINRIDNDRHYEKGNVEWATDKDQSRNQRKSKREEVGGFKINSEPCRLIHLGGTDWMIVDEKNYERVNSRIWYPIKADSGQLYAHSGARREEYKSAYAQRLVMNAKPGDRIKFRNGNGFDVRESNLYIHGEFSPRKKRT